VGTPLSPPLPLLLPLPRLTLRPQRVLPPWPRVVPEALILVVVPVECDWLLNQTAVRRHAAPGLDLSPLDALAVGRFRELPLRFGLPHAQLAVPQASPAALDLRFANRRRRSSHGSGGGHGDGHGGGHGSGHGSGDGSDGGGDGNDGPEESGQENVSDDESNGSEDIEGDGGDHGGSGEARALPATLRFVVTQPGTLHAFAFWFRQRLYRRARRRNKGGGEEAGEEEAEKAGEDSEEWLDTGPAGKRAATQHWRQAAVAVAPPRTVRVGQVLLAAVRFGKGVPGGVDVRFINTE
jgi:hypothetical protein